MSSGAGAPAGTLELQDAMGSSQPQGLDSKGADPDTKKAIAPDAPIASTKASNSTASATARSVVRSDGDAARDLALEQTRVVACAAIREFTRRKRFIFLLGLLFGVLVMVFEDPVSYCATKQVFWSREALIRTDPLCAAQDYGSMVPQRLSRGLSELSIATQQAGLGLKERVARLQIQRLVDFVPIPKNPFSGANSSASSGAAQDPSQRVRSLGYEPRHPVVMLPGIVTTGLELWQGEPCAQSYFRQRVWGTYTSLNMFLRDPGCWRRHMQLNRTTGLDPDGVRLRASLGFEGADFLVGGYWVWAKLIQALGEVGYTSNEMELKGYDWRLSFENLEKRDRYFTRLRASIETLVELNGEKAVVVVHSMGGNVWFYFMHWVQSDLGGNAGPTWLDDHVEAVVAIGAPFLGVVSALPRLLTGVIREFEELGTLISNLIQLHMNLTVRAQLMRSWGSVYSLLPRGGDRVWNAADGVRPKIYTPEQDELADQQEQQQLGDEDTDENDTGLGETLVDTPANLAVSSGGTRTFATLDDGTLLGVDAVMDQLFKGQNGDPSIDMYAPQNSFGPPPDPDTPTHDPSPSEWTNVLRAPLPTEKMKIYCLYGYGKHTERAYHYRTSNGGSGVNASQWTADGGYRLDSSLNSDDPDGEGLLVRGGVTFVDGDGSVPLLSLGLACADLWKSGTWHNPKGTPVVTREYLDRPTGIMANPFRGGPRSGDHVDIMGNQELIEDILYIATGHGERVEPRIESQIEEMAKRLNLTGRQKPASAEPQSCDASVDSSSCGTD